MSRIVLAESDAAVRARVHDELLRVGHEVDSVRTLDEAVLALSATRLVDVLLAGLAGSAAPRLVELGRQVSPGTRSVLVTDPTSEPQTRAAMVNGAVSVLTRPFAYAELHDAIATASECGVGFYGFFHGLSLLDLLQIFHVARRSVRLSVGGPVEGQLFLRHGELVHALVGDLQGVDALASLLTGTDSGWVHTAPLGEDFQDTIQAHFDGLLLDVLRLSDERERGTTWTTPPMDFSIEQVASASSCPPPEEFEGAAMASAFPENEDSDFSNPSTSEVEPALREQVDAWLRQCRANGTLTSTMQIVAVASSSGDGVTLHGDMPSDGVPDAAVELRGVLERITGKSHAAVVEYTTDRGGVVVCCDASQRSLLVLAEEIREGSVTTWFRWRGSALGRAFAPQLYADKRSE